MKKTLSNRLKYFSPVIIKGLFKKIKFRKNCCIDVLDCEIFYNDLSTPERRIYLN